MMCGCLLLCSLVGFTVGLPQPFKSNSVQAFTQPVQHQLNPVNTVISRDYQVASNQVATGTHNTGYASGDTDVGEYYYYMPVEEEYGHQGGGGAAAAAAAGAAGAQQHELMTPLLIIIVLLVAILLQMALPGILNALVTFVGPLFPALVFQPVTIPVPAPGRALIDNQIYSWENLIWLTQTVRSAIEVDECIPHLVCSAAHYADGSNAVLTLLENMPSEEYSSYVKIFKDSTLRKVDCNNYKCESPKVGRVLLENTLGKKFGTFGKIKLI